VIATPVFQVTASVVIALFVLQVLRRVSANRDNAVLQGINGGLNFLFSG
jgi:hypothetical protein